MRVIHIIDTLNVGGAERVMVNLCNWQYEQGLFVQAAIITSSCNDLQHLIQTGIPIHFIGREKRLSFYAAKKLFSLITECDIVHVHMRHNYRYVRAICLCLNKKVKIILHDHSSSSKMPFGLNGLFKPKFFIGTSLFSMQFAEYILKMKSNFFLLENVIENISIKTVEKKEGFILVSNIKESKNQLFALEIMKYFQNKLHFYGVVQEDMYLNTLQDRISHLALTENVNIFTNVNNVQPLLSNYELGIHTSANETGPLTIIEYLSQGLPFLAYSTGEAAKKISYDFPEFFIDNFEVDKWVARIRLILSSPPDKNKMQQVFEKHFSKKAYIEKCLKIYQSVLHS